MARGKPRSDGATSIFSTDFNVNISMEGALRDARAYESTLDHITAKLQRLEQLPTRTMGAPTFAGPMSRAALSPFGDALPGQPHRRVNPTALVFSNNALTGGQTSNRRDPVPIVTDGVSGDREGTPRPITRETPRRSSSERNRNPGPFDNAFEQGAGRQRMTAPYYQPQNPTQPLSRRQQILQQRQYGREGFYDGVNLQRAADRTYTVLPSDGTVRGALDGPTAPDAPYPMRGPFDYRRQRYPSERLSARDRVLNKPNLRDEVFTAQGAADRMYTVIPSDGSIRGALPERAGYAQGSSSSLYDESSGFAPTSSPWEPTRRAQVAHAVSPGFDTLRRGVDDIGAGASRAGHAFSTSSLVSAASSVFLLEQLGQTVGRLGQGTVGQSMRIDEYRALLANSLLGDGVGRRGADRLAGRLIGSEFFGGLDISTSELGLSRADLAEQYKGLAPIVRVGSEGPQDFVQRLQRGAVLSQLLLARDPTQGQTGVNVALSELLAGGSTRFLSLSRRFELSNSQLRGIETGMGGEGSADPVAVAIAALETMGLGPDYLKTRAATMSGELEQSGALFGNLRADAFQQGTGVLAGNLRTVNNALSSYRNTEAYERQLERTGGGVAGAFDLITRPLVQGIAGNLLRSGGALDEGYLARSASELMMPGEQRGRRGYVSSETGDILGAAEAFREAALTIQEAHLERLLEQPQYSPKQQTTMDTLLGTGASIGGAVLLNRLFGGAGGLLLHGAMTSGVGGAAALAAAGAAAAPAAIVAGGAAAAGVTVAAYRRGSMSRDIYRQLEDNNPALLDELNVSAAQRGQINRFADRDGVIGVAYNMAMRNRDIAMNVVTGGRFGESTYGERWGSFDQFLAQQGQRGTVEDALADMAATEWQPGMTRRQLVGPLRERVFDLQREGQQNPDSPVGQFFKQESALELAMSAVDKAWETAPQDFNRGLLGTAVEKAFSFDKPLSIVDPETGKRQTLRAGFSPDEGQAFVERMVSDDPTIPGGVNQDVLTPRINRAMSRLEAAVARAERGNAGEASTWRQLNLSVLPGVFSDYDPAPDRRELITSTVPLSALGQRDRSKLRGGGRQRSGFIEVPIQPEPSLEPLPLLRPRRERSQARMGAVEHPPSLRSRERRMGFSRTAEDATAAFYGGRSSGKNHAEHLHGGFDVLATGGFNSPANGQVDYLRSAEDYENPLYETMFPGGRDIYGVSAVVRDRFGKVHSVSHLQDLPYKEGRVKKGGYIGAQGNTGLTYSSAFPGQRIQDGRLPDGESAYGRGGHGHVQFGQLKDGKYEELDPQLAPSYWQASPAEQGRTGAVSFSPNISINIEKGADRETLKRNIDEGLDELKGQMYNLMLNGDLDDIFDAHKDIKASQGVLRDGKRPRPRGDK